jgi:hypothetical protein
MSTPSPCPLVSSEPWPVSKYMPYSPPRCAACRSIDSSEIPKVAFASSLPARLWNQIPVLPGAAASSAACTSMCASTQCGSSPATPKVSRRSSSVASTAATAAGSLEAGLVPSSRSPTPYAQPSKTCQRMSSGWSVGEFGCSRAARRPRPPSSRPGSG